MHFALYDHPIFVNISLKKKQIKQIGGSLTKLAIGTPGGCAAEADQLFDTTTMVTCRACNKNLDSDHFLVKNLVETVV
jgi:hypothetical protein